LVAAHVSGRSFADIGCMWSVNGAIAFAAEEAGASRVTGLDVMGPTPDYEAEHARRNSTVRFIQGDLHDPATIESIGVHDVVWCSGVLYHAPHPLLTLERLAQITGETLILATEILPGKGATAVFAPEPGSHPAHTEPFDPARGYVNWFWGLRKGAVIAMLEASGFEPVDIQGDRHHLTVVSKRK